MFEKKIKERQQLNVKGILSTIKFNLDDLEGEHDLVRDRKESVKSCRDNFVLDMRKRLRSEAKISHEL